MTLASFILRGQGGRLLGLRGLHASALAYKAQVFGMPAMSPTMERGGVVEWKFKVGDTFSAGDVLLEVETDKAQIDVEAQDDGKIASIIKDNGSKDIKVGEPIAYLADIDDDLSTLEIPKAEPAQAKQKSEEKSQPKKEAVPKAGIDAKSAEKEASSKSSNKSSSGPGKDASSVLVAANNSQTLLPSVQMLLHENGISFEDAMNKIKASGPNGRILKGDVLSYLGKIPQKSVVKVTEYIKKGEALDLSNIELKKIENTPAAQKGKPAKAEPIVFEEHVRLEVPADVSVDKLALSLKSYVSEANWLSHDYQVTNTRSQFYDPIFEDLITPDSKQPRFRFKYDLVPLSTQSLSQRQNDDIFDLLSGSAPSKTAKVEKAQPNEFLVNFTVEVSDKYSDAEIKANRFLDYMKDLESITEH